MATLGNLLKQEGGTAFTGRHVKLALAIPSKDGGIPNQVEAEVLLLPVGLRKRAKAIRAADTYIEEQQALVKENGPSGSVVPDAGDERVFRFFLEAMRDPEDPRKSFVESDKTETFRNIITFDQLQVLIREYAELIRSEFPETLSSDEQTEIAQQAKETFLGAQR